MQLRLGSFALLVAAVLLSDILGNMIGNFFEALFKAGVLALLIVLVRSRGNGSQTSQKPSSGSLRGLWRSSSTEQVVDYQTTPADQAKRRPY